MFANLISLFIKLLILSILLLFFTLPTTVLAKEVDLRVNGVSLSTTETVVLRKFGKPLESKEGEFDECGNGYRKTLSYSGLEIEFISDEKRRNFTVIAIEVISSKWLVSGIRIGMDAKDIEAEFGTSEEKKAESGLEAWSYVNKGNDGFAGFYFRDNKLVKILWESALC